MDFNWQPCLSSCHTLSHRLISDATLLCKILTHSLHGAWCTMGIYSKPSLSLDWWIFHKVRSNWSSINAVWLGPAVVRNFVSQTRCSCRPVERVGRGINYSGPRDVWGLAVAQKYKIQGGPNKCPNSVSYTHLTLPTNREV